MLTPAEISGRELVKAMFGGYDMTGVDDFLEEITSDYTMLYKENGSLKNKLKVLVEKIEEYRSTEDAMRMALLTAQKMGDDLIADAKRRAAEINERSANESAERRREIDNLLSDENARLAAARAETAKYVEATKRLAAEHVEFLDKLDSISRAPEPAPAAPTREEIIQDTAREIDSAVEKLISDAMAAQEKPAAAAPQDEAEPTKTFTPRGNDEDEDTSPRPKFDFDNLKFGINFKDN